MNSRRNFLKALSAGGVALMSGIPAASWGATSAHVVIIGGGTGGATAAKYLKIADPSINVTLIERNADYYTCYMSNEVLGGDRTLDSLKFGYDGLRARGINVVHEEVTGIDSEARVISTLSGTTFNYDRCIVSPGIGFHYDLIEGYDESMIEDIPHSWKAGPQTTLLRSQLEAMDDGGTFVMTAPPNPYRCPPAPYERASQVAYYFKRHKPNSKVIIVDPKGSFAKQSLFIEGWMDLYNYGDDSSGIEWVSQDGITELDAATKTITSASGEKFKGDVLNIIPPQKAGALAFAADLVDESGWCPISVKTFESTRHANIHVIGDACAASPLPKSGFAANSEGKACALAIAALLNDREPGRTSFTNGCYSLVSDDYAISIVAVYRLTEDGTAIAKVAGAGGMTPSDATAQDKLIDVEYAYSWYNNFTRDIFF